jgi:hypothetical protein
MKKSNLLMLCLAAQFTYTANGIAQAKTEPKNQHFGTCVHFNQGWDYTKVLPLVADLGVAWIRDDLNWRNVEKTKGVYVVPEKTMDWIKQAHKNGLKLILILNRENKLYEDPYDPDAYAAFCKAMAVQLKDDVDAFEILNEPANFGFRKQYGGTWNGLEPDGKSIGPWVGKYVTFINKAAEAIKSVNKKIKVIGLGSVPPVNFRQLAMGVSPSVDGIVDHPYSYRSVPEIISFPSSEAGLKRDGIATADERGTLTSMVDMYRKQSEKYNGPKELWFTESGWPTFQPLSSKILNAGLTESAQAIYLQRRFIQYLGMDIDVALQYDLKNDGNDPHELEHNYGIVHADYTPKPAYYAYQRVAKNTVGFIHKNMVVNITPGPGRVDPYPMIWEGTKMPAVNDIPVYTFVNPKGQEVVTLWSAERANNEFQPRFADIEFKTEKKVSKITVMDMLTGVTSNVPFKATEGGAMLKTYSVPDHVLMFTID